MKVKYSLLYASSLTLAVMGATPVQAGWLDFLSDSTEKAAETMQQGSETLNKVDQTLQAGEAATQAVPTTQSELTGILMQQTGVTQAQAEGGAGAMFQVAKQRMTDEGCTHNCRCSLGSHICPGLPIEIVTPTIARPPFTLQAI